MQTNKYKATFTKNEKTKKMSQSCFISNPKKLIICGNFYSNWNFFLSNSSKLKAFPVH